MHWARGVIPSVTTRFVNEGVAVAFDLNVGRKIDRAKEALAGTGTTSVLDLWTNGNSASETLLYPVAGAFMEYMYNQNQPAKFDSLIKHQDIDDAKVIYGATRFDQLIADFDRQLGL